MKNTLYHYNHQLSQHISKNPQSIFKNLYLQQIPHPKQSFIPYINQRDHIGRLIKHKKQTNSDLKASNQVRFSNSQIYKIEQNLITLNDSQQNCSKYFNMIPTLNTLSSSIKQKNQDQELNKQICLTEVCKSKQIVKQKYNQKKFFKIMSEQKQFGKKYEHGSLPALKKHKLKKENDYILLGFYESNENIQKFKYKRTPTMTIYRNREKLNKEQKPNRIDQQKRDKKILLKKKSFKNVRLFQNLRELVLQKDPQIQKMKRPSKLSIKIVQNFDENIQFKLNSLLKDTRPSMFLNGLKKYLRI